MDHPFTLDHFYIVLPDRVFQSIKEQTIRDYGAIHKVVVSGANSWEGLYIFTKEGVYFEILRQQEEGIQGRVGIALSHRDTNFDSVEYCQKYPYSLVEVINKVDKPWFISISNAKCPEVPMAYVWIMHYLDEFKESRFEVSPDAIINDFSSVDFYTNQKVIDEFKLYKDWVPVSQEMKFKLSNNKELTIRLHLAVDEDYKFEIHA